MSWRVLHVTDSYPPEQGGVERVVEQLAAGQVRRGMQVTVLTKALPDLPLYESRADGVNVMRYRHAARPTPLVWLTSWWHGRRLADGLRLAAAPDVIHYHLTLSAQGPLGIFAGRTPGVYSFYGPWHAEFEVEAEDLFAKRSALYRRYLRGQIRVQRLMQIRLLRRAERVVVLSDFSRLWVEKLASRHGSEVIRVPGGIDPARFHPEGGAAQWRQKLQLPEKAFVICTVRRLVRRMGLDLLLEAVRLVKDRGNEVVCLIGGQGPLLDELQVLARRLGVAEQCRFLGFVPEDDLPQLYRLADLFVVPSRAEENFGLIVLEAAACGTPVAATPSGSLPELLKATDERYLAQEITASALAEVILKAARDGSQSKEFFRQTVAPRVSKEYSWEAMIDRITDLYSGLGLS